MARLVHIHGERGRWLAEVEGRWLAVLHNTFWQKPDRYRAPLFPEHLGQKRYEELVEALRRHDLVVMQRDKDRTSLARDGYIGLFRFTDLVIDTTDRWELSLTLTDRYADPKAR